MSFYTNVYLHKNEFLIRGYDGGKRIQHTVPATPWLFVNNSRVGGEEFKTLQGKSVYKKTFESIYDARAYVKDNQGVHGIELYGMTNWLYPFINEQYSGIIDYDANLISVTTIDIETDSEGGFPDIATADKQIITITVRRKDKSVALGFFDFVPEDENVTYIKCTDEVDLLNKFILFS